MKEDKKYYNSLSHSTDKVSGSNEFEEKLPMDAMLENANTLSASSTSRRDFLKFLGFSSVAATVPNPRNFKKSLLLVEEADKVSAFSHIASSGNFSSNSL